MKKKKLTKSYLERCRMEWVQSYENKKNKYGLKEQLEVFDRVAKRNDIELPSVNFMKG